MRILYESGIPGMTIVKLIQHGEILSIVEYEGWKFGVNTNKLTKLTVKDYKKLV